MFALMSRSGTIRIKSSLFSSFSGSLSIIAGSLLVLEMSTTLGNNSLLLSASRSTNGFGSASDSEPSFGV